jgi:Na+-driven multidrug efflux pump
VCELITVSVYTAFIDKKLKLRPKDIIKLDTGMLRDFIKYGTPIVLAQLVWATNTLSATAIMSRISAIGVTAAMSIAGSMNSLAYVVMNGAAGAVGIIIGKTIGSGNLKKIKEYSYTTEALFIILGLISGALLFLFKGYYVSIYNVSEEAKEVALSLITVLSVTFIGTCYQSACLFGLVKSGGDVSFILKNDAFFIFLIVIPSAVIALRLGLAPWAVFLCLKSDQLLKCIPAAIKINRFGWVNPLTKGSPPKKNEN